MDDLKDHTDIFFSSCSNSLSLHEPSHPHAFNDLCTWMFPKSQFPTQHYPPEPQTLLCWRISPLEYFPEMSHSGYNEKIFNMASRVLIIWPWLLSGLLFHLVSAHLSPTIHNKPTCISLNTFIWTWTHSFESVPFLPGSLLHLVNSHSISKRSSKVISSQMSPCLPNLLSASLMSHMLSWINSATSLIPVLYFLGSALLDIRNNILSFVSVELIELRSIPDTWQIFNWWLSSY